MRKNTGIKTCAAIHDISGIGKCSLTVALPILSALGVETGVLPTAVLSNHTGFASFSYRDLTGDILGFAQNWKKEGAGFDALYSGFMGSAAQIDLVAEIFTMFRTADNLIVVDPVMGDHGKLYKTYTPEMAQKVGGLCKKADLIVPNLTEAAYLTNMPYQADLKDKQQIEALLYALADLGPSRVVLTGIGDNQNRIGCACLCKHTGAIAYSFHKKYSGSFHGTGDIFASVLTGALLRDFTMELAQEMACVFVGDCIAATIQSGRNSVFGVLFEQCLPSLFQKVMGKG